MQTLMSLSYDLYHITELSSKEQLDAFCVVKPKVSKYPGYLSTSPCGAFQCEGYGFISCQEDLIYFPCPKLMKTEFTFFSELLFSV